MTETKAGQGLRGISAGQTAIATCGKEGFGLTYRGYDILELAEQSSFAEVAYLLLHGHLPSPSELQAYRRDLADACHDRISASLAFSSINVLYSSLRACLR